MGTDEKVKTNNKITEDISRLMALAEAYPNLKANEGFIDLSKALTKVEDEIANSRKYYNATVRLLNNRVQMFPSNIVALLFGFKTRAMFEALDDERNNVKVEL